MGNEVTDAKKDHGAKKKTPEQLQLLEKFYSGINHFYFSFINLYTLYLFLIASYYNKKHFRYITLSDFLLIQRRDTLIRRQWKSMLHL